MKSYIFRGVVILLLFLFLAHKKKDIKSSYDKLHHIMRSLYDFLKKAQGEVKKEKWNFLDEFDKIYTMVKDDLKQLRPSETFAQERKIFVKGYFSLKKDLIKIKKIGKKKDVKAMKRLMNIRLNLRRGGCVYCHSQLSPEVVKKIWQVNK